MKTWQLLKQNPALFERYFIKEYIIKAVRAFFEQRNYHELESPILASALPQERYLDALETQIELAQGKRLTAYLLPSTETFNKKMLAAGLGNHFVITKVFRGLEEIGPNHSPEFTMLEWYEVGNNYQDLMRSCEELLPQIKELIDSKQNKKYTPEIKYQGKTISFTAPWYRFSIRELLQKYLNLKLEEVNELADLAAYAQSRNFNVSREDSWQDIFELLFAGLIEPELPQDKPLFIYDYPKIMCPLTKQKASDPLVCEKVELYIAGKEIANGYTELTDGVEQQKRFELEQAARQKLGRKAIKFDQDLVHALNSGIPETAGIGMGLDRLAMIFADAQDISQINFFPGTELDD